MSVRPRRRIRGRGVPQPAEGGSFKSVLKPVGHAFKSAANSVNKAVIKPAVKSITPVVEKAIPRGSSRGYRHAILGWQEDAQNLKRNIGYVPGTLLHYWHGKKSNRRYFDRWKILTSNQFDPVTDLKRDWQGLWALAGNKIALRDQLMAYFRGRDEDSIDAE